MTVRDVPLSIVVDGHDYLTSFRNTFGVVPLLKSIRGRTEVRIGSTRDGIVVMDAATAPGAGIDFPNWGIELSLDNRRGLMPGRIELYRVLDQKRIVMTRREVQEWKKLSNEWAPTKIVTRQFETDPKYPDTFGEVCIELTMQIDIARSKWNTKIPEGEFESPVPPALR